MNWLYAALDCIAAGDPAVLVTVAEAKGSTPRESGAKMLVRVRDIVGSVGGGQLELLAIDAARRLMTDGARQPDLMRYSLGPDLGQCCGGRVLLTIERFTATDREAAAVLAAAERLGVLSTISTVGPDGRLRRQVADAVEGPAYQVRADARVHERFGVTLVPEPVFVGVSMD